MAGDNDSVIVSADTPRELSVWLRGRFTALLGRAHHERVPNVGFLGRRRTMLDDERAFWGNLPCDRCGGPVTSGLRYHPSPHVAVTVWLCATCAGREGVTS